VEAEVGALRDSLAAVGCEDWLLPPATPEEIGAVVEAVAPFVIPSELLELWSLHAGTDTGSRYWDWFLGWGTPAWALQLREWSLGNSEFFPGVWPYWNDDRWLPFTAHDRSTFFVVLGLEPTARSVVGVHSSSALDVRVQQSSLRSWVLSLDLLIRTLGEFGLDPRDEQIRPYGWWDTMEPPEPGWELFPEEVLEPIRTRLPGVAAIDAGATWPTPDPFRVSTTDPLGGPWMPVLGVDPS